jgi:cytochrome c oxidase cbb3-type subunit 4
MDINTIRIATTVISFAFFVAIVLWAYSKRRADDFKAAANLPFEQD